MDLNNHRTTLIWKQFGNIIVRKYKPSIFHKKAPGISQELVSSGGLIIEFKPITVDFKGVYLHHFPSNLYELSDLSLVSLWIWRRPYDVSWTIIEDFLCIRCRYRGETYFLPPLGAHWHKLPLVIHHLQRYSMANGSTLVFRSIPTAMVRPILEAAEYKVRMIEDRPSWDYVYRTQDLLELKGRKYQQQRQALRKFRQKYSYAYTPLVSSDRSAIESVFDAWAEAHPDSHSVDDERIALNEAIHHQHDLGIKGGGLRIDEKLVAFAMGSALTPETALIHFEKAHPEYQGIYAAMNWEFLHHAWHHTQTVNREDDLGLPNLREAKNRLHPVGMVEKYTLEFLD